MLKKILIGLAVLLIVLVVSLVAVIATRPSEFRYSRSRAMAVTPAAAFAQVNDFHKWDAWSPWAKLDPKCKNSFSGPDSGKGAKFAWAGNNEVGEGAMTIIESRPPELIHIHLEFIKPMPGVSLTEFTFKPEGDKTVVTWTMSGENNFVGKAIGLVMDCEKMCGDMFEKGLEGIEKAAKAEASQNVSKEGTILLKTYPGRPNYESIANGDEAETYLVLSTHGSVSDPAEFQLFFENQMESPALHDSVRGLVGRKVIVSGNLWPALTGHHHTEFVFTVTDAKPL